MAAVLVLVAGGAQAATLNVVGGQLLGASGVIVDGSSYSVEFLDGTCIALYNGCDDVSDFTFQTQAAATLASQALLDPVFLDGADLFDSDPTLTNGCTEPVVCLVSTPWSIFVNPVNNVVSASNLASIGGDLVGNEGFGSNSDFASLFFQTYAVWSPVPEPTTALLLGLGLAGLAAKGRRRNRS